MKKTKNILTGIAAAPGLAIARAHLFLREREEISNVKIKDVNDAIKSFDDAIAQSKKELNKVFSLAIDKLGEKRAAIFEAQIMILDDPILIGNIRKRIKKEKKLPEYIVYDEITKYQDLMNASHEAYMKERSQDIGDIKNRIIKNLKKKKWKSRITSDVIVIGETLTPADTVLFSRAQVKGLVTDFGGLTSHTAIVARSLDIPAVVGTRDATSRINDGDLIILDGFHGLIIINPSDSQLDIYYQKIKKLTLYDKKLTGLKSKTAVTLDGRKITLQANLDVSEEIELIIKNGSEGIGLVRTEQLFHDTEQFPDEEYQYKFYKKLAEKIYPKKITIRAFDVGGDKVLPFDVKEPNPMLGWRGIRFLLDNSDLFKAQIRSVLRANIHKNIQFMLPMISEIIEVERTQKLIKDCILELTEKGIKHEKDLRLGIMVEIPSAAVMTREFSDIVDFISIGTNDLIQYLLAVDRGNEIVSMQYQEFHPALIRTVKYIIDDAQCGEDCVSMCGEMAADTLAIPLLVGLGLTTFSVSPSAIPNIKKIIRSLKYSEVKRLANRCLKMRTADEVGAILQKFSTEKLSDQLQNII